MDTRTRDVAELHPGRTGNRLLDSLPHEPARVLLGSAVRVRESRNQQVYAQDGSVDHVHFPTSAVYASVLATSNGQRSEVGSVGNEGMVGLPAYLGIDTSPSAVIVQVPGEAIRVPAAEFQRASSDDGAVDALVRRYIAYWLHSANQGVLCSAVHPLRERACRWLLTASDRAGGGPFFMTHELLAQMVGVRRQSVSIVAGSLQRTRVIGYRRGRVSVLDRQRLEESTCECYGALRRVYDRLLDPQPAH
jgi:CRP-like cAMP-binding protein